MKILTAQEMARIEKIAYAQGAKEEAFMEQAGKGVAELAQHCIAKYRLSPSIIALCGHGNNGGDAYVACRVLKRGGFTTQAYALRPLEESSPLCRLQAERFLAMGGTIHFLESLDNVTFEKDVLLLDGLLGTGFHGSVSGLMKQLIDCANHSGAPILAIDIPSGIDGTKGTYETAIHATDTLFLGHPKTGCFLGEAWDLVGNVYVYDYGLPKEISEQAQADFFMLESSAMSHLLPSLKRTRHKYQAGYVVGLGGSPGMPGAPLLTSLGALRAGAGIVRLLHPGGMEEQFAAAPIELIRQAYPEGNVDQILTAMQRASALFIGPGFGQAPASENLLRSLLPRLPKPCVIDAEALTLLAKEMVPLPPLTILTPHHGEMLRLLKQEHPLPIQDLLKAAQEFVDHHRIIVVLKGSPTFILYPGSKPSLCPRGDPGMATAGSGDVLTGVIAAFLAQQLPPFEAACLGVYLHAMAGEFAADELSSFSMIASDIISSLPQAIKTLLPSHVQEKSLI